jgi:hypothetical protein
MTKKLTWADKKKIFLNSTTSNLKPQHLTLDEIADYVARREEWIKHFEGSIIRTKQTIAYAKEEASKRPKGKTYPPGIYFDNTPVMRDCFSDSPSWVVKDGDIVVVDYEGCPWFYFGGDENDGWHRFGLSMNSTAERVWEWIGDI